MSVQQKRAKGHQSQTKNASFGFWSPSLPFVMQLTCGSDTVAKAVKN